MGIKEDLVNLGVIVEYHFSERICIKETRIPAGVELTQHEHNYEHASVLVSGTVMLIVEGESTRLSGYQTLKIKAGARHKVHAFTDAIWLCIAPTEEVEHELRDHDIMEID